MGRIVKAARLETRPSPICPEARRAALLLARAQVEASCLRRRSKSAVIELSVRMAEKIVGETVVQKPSVLNRIYEEALSSMPECPRGTLTVHPLDRNASGVDTLAEQSGFRLVEDESVGRGGVRVCAGGVSVDASLEAALEAIGGAVLELIDD